METGCAEVLPTPKRTIHTRHSTSACRAGSRSRQRLLSKSVSMSSTFSTLSTNCATAAASESERGNLASVAVFMARWRTVFETDGTALVPAGELIYSYKYCLAHEATLVVRPFFLGCIVATVAYVSC